MERDSTKERDLKQILEGKLIFIVLGINHLPLMNTYGINYSAKYFQSAVSLKPKLLLKIGSILFAPQCFYDPQ